MTREKRQETSHEEIPRVFEKSMTKDLVDLFQPKASETQEAFSHMLSWYSLGPTPWRYGIAVSWSNVDGSDDLSQK